MKSTIRIVLAVLLISIPGLRCTKDADPIKKICYPTMITTSASGFTSAMSYSYNSNHEVLSTSLTTTTGTNTTVVTTAFTYNSDGQIISSSENSSSSGVSTGTYTYDINHNLKQEDHSAGGILQSSFIYHYNSTLQLIGVEYAYFGLGANTSTTNYEYQVPVARNPIKIISTTGAVWTYEYDTKPNPLKVLFVSLQPDNNVTKLTYTSGGSTTTSVYTYQYDANRYPVSRTSSDGEAKTYAYDCK